MGEGRRGFERVTSYGLGLTSNDWMVGKWRCFSSNARNVTNGMRASQVSILRCQTPLAPYVATKVLR